VKLRVSSGFLGGADLEFVDGLNCLIGGRGTGKTTALELLRYGLGLMPDPKVNAQRHRAIDGLVKSNLGHGRLTVELRTKTGMTYTATRATGEDVQVLDALGKAVPISLGDDLIFGADVFSQNEIEEIASSPAAQLTLLDRFAEADTVAVRRELDAIGRQLEQSALRLLRLDDDIEDLAAKASELPALEEKLKGLAEVAGPDAARLNEAHAQQVARKREAQVPPLLQAAIDKVVADFARVDTAFRGTVAAHLVPDLGAGPNAEVFRPMSADVTAFTNVVHQALTEVRAGAAGLTVRMQGHATVLVQHHAGQEAAYRALLSVSEELVGRTAERASLQTAYVAAQAVSKELDSKRHERAAALAERQTLLNRASDLRDERFELRKRVADRLTHQFQSIRVTVAQAEDLEAYCGLVTDMLKGAGLKHGMVAEKLTQVFLPSELADLVARNDASGFSQRAAMDDDRARKALSALRASRRVYDLETVELQDRPSIELLDGERYKRSPHLSTGQRCTTILPILLLQSERPLLIDQPEDNLDNAFVYETVVAALKAVKGTRQVIFVTHNPNIPVLGQAERVFVFSSDGQQGSVLRAGTVDECKDQIERILEGGREAFRLRKERYGH
jgi:ABC-type uncharacterized transport system ATPase subunit